MIDFIKLNYTSKAYFLKYMQSFARSLPARTQRLIKEMVFGMIASSSARLSEIGRALNEDIELDTTIKRLSLNLSFADFSTTVEQICIRRALHYLAYDFIIVIDGSDMAKPRARSMEGLATIHDGSEKTTAKGYPLLTVALVGSDRRRVIPVITRLFSRLEKSYLSDNDEFDKVLSLISNRFGTKGVYVLDRGFCSSERMKSMENTGFSFVIRTQARTVYVGETTQDIMEWGREKDLTYSVMVEQIRNGNIITRTIRYTISPIRIGEQNYHAVILRLEDHEIAILITNIRIGSMKNATFGEKIIRYYGCRWSIEEKIRFEKDTFDVEDIRVRSLVALKNYVAITMVTSCFIDHLAYEHLRGKRMTARIIEVGKPLREDVRLRYYQIAMGLRDLWSKSHGRIFHFKTRHKGDPDPLPLLPDWE